MPDIDQLLEQGLAAHQAGRAKEAEEIYRQILAADPDDTDALQLLGILLAETSRHQDGYELLARAVKINPAAPDCHFNFGKILAQLRRHEEAVDALRKSIELQDDVAEAHFFLGLSLRSLGWLDESAAEFRRAVYLRPDYVEAMNNLGIVLKSQGRMEEAVAEFRRAHALRPDVMEIRYNLGNALMEQGDYYQGNVVLSDALGLRREDPRIHSNYLLGLQFQTNKSPELIFQEHQDWNRRHGLPLAVAHERFANPGAPGSDRRLRIGYVSPDFREHSLAFFIEPLLSHHDPAQVEVFCYSSASRSDPVTDRLRKHSHQWRNISGEDDESVAKIVRHDSIDILVDLCGHLAGNRLLAFARKPAPIQVTYLGYPNTTGLSAIDYRLTDAHVDPPGQTENLNSEKLLRLPNTFAAFRPSPDAPPVSELPAVARGYVTFASFNALNKLNPTILELWARILSQAPRSRLLIVADGMQRGQVQQYLSDFFAGHSIAADRLTLQGSQPLADYLALHREVDLALDTFPLNGHTVTCHALWMGVPVVTLRGRTCAQRLGAGVLANLELDDLVATGADEYVQIAVELAGNTDRLRELRLGMRGRMTDSPILDGISNARNVEAAYRSMWLNWIRA